MQADIQWYNQPSKTASDLSLRQQILRSTSYPLLIPSSFLLFILISPILPQDWLKICTTEPQINFLFLGYPLVTSPIYFNFSKAASRLAQDMHTRASDQLLIPWLSLGHFSCLVPNLLVYISRLSYILSCIATLRITVEYIFVYSMHRRYARNMDLACYLICLHRAVYIIQASPEHASG